MNIYWVVYQEQYISKFRDFPLFFLYVDVRYLIHACLVSLPVSSQQKISRQFAESDNILLYSISRCSVSLLFTIREHCYKYIANCEILLLFVWFYSRRIKFDIKLRYFTIEIYTWINLRTSSILKTCNFTTLRDRKNYINFYGKFLTV